VAHSVEMRHQVVSYAWRIVLIKELGMVPRFGGSVIDMALLKKDKITYSNS
jgi:hypothetical protein